MDPGDALLIRADLQRAREQFVMSTELHLTYLVVPANNYDITPNWKTWVAGEERWGYLRVEIYGIASCLDSLNFGTGQDKEFEYQTGWINL
eukprot:scaffold241370_cov15-Tisochrysis_lutea.AAC.1